MEETYIYSVFVPPTKKYQPAIHKNAILINWQILKSSSFLFSLLVVSYFHKNKARKFKLPFKLIF